MSSSPAAEIAAIEARSQRIETPCGDGMMVWRSWGEGEPLVLLHGGSGTWRHWLRNIEHFAKTRRVIAADMPGYGDSAEPPQPTGFPALGRIMGEGLDSIIGAGATYDIMGFSLGSFMAPWVVSATKAKARKLVLVHGHFIGRMQYSPQDRLKRWRGVEDRTERDAILRNNLGALMLADGQSADDLTLEVYRTDLELSRLRVPTFIDTLDTTILNRVDVRLYAITGAADPTSNPSVEAQQSELKAFRPDAKTWIIPGAGHWAMWEAASAFHGIADQILAEN
jgi:pimeloyl-ACP methyl ester carboxylesterase